MEEEHEGAVGGAPPPPVIMEELDCDKLRRSRSAYLGKLTRAKKELLHAMENSDQATVVLKKRDALSQVYALLDSAHEVFMHSIKDPDIAKGEDQFLKDIDRDMNELYEHVDNWFKTAAHHAQLNENRSNQSDNGSVDTHWYEEKDREVQELTTRMRELESFMRSQEYVDATRTTRPKVKYPCNSEPLTNVTSSQYFTVPNVHVPVSGIDNIYSRNLRKDEEPIPSRVAEVSPPPARDAGGNWTSTLERAIISLCEFVKDSRTNQMLPQPEIPRFSGQPAEYPLFIHSFDVYVDKRIEDSSLKLSLLISLCDGLAKRCIKDLVLNPNSLIAYTEARAILFRRFGRPDIISHAKLDSLINGPTIENNDGESLLDLATEMKSCELTLASLNYHSSIDNCDNLVKIMWRLPLYLQSNWARVANDISFMGRDPTFKDLTTFVYNAATVATNFYGKNVRPHSKSTNQKHKSTFKPKSRVMAVVGSDDVNDLDSCPYCDNQHKFSECEKFEQLEFSQKKEFMWNQQRCNNCLKTGHSAKGCFSKQRCTVKDCGKKHHKIMHIHRKFKPTQMQSTCITSVTPQQTQVNAGAVNSLCNTRSVYLRVLPVLLQANGNTVFTNALMDSGSQLTLCTEDIMKELDCCNNVTNINISTINESSKCHTTYKSSLCVKSMSDDSYIDVPDVHSVQSLPDLSHLQHKDSSSQFKGIELPSLNPGGIGILIGANVPEAFWVLEQTSFSKDQPYATRTLLGWSLLGPCSKQVVSPEFNVNACFSSDDLLLRLTQRFWTQDFPEVCNNEATSMSVEDRKVVEKMDKKTVLSHGHFVLPLPFKNDPPKIKCNKALATKRLMYLKNRLAKDPGLHRKYTETMESYIASSYAIKVDPVQSSYYIPHHPVIHPLKENVRVVFDCAAKWQGTSLNDQLFSGPDMANNLLGVLLRFRKGPIALASDIQAMFHQVKVTPEHSSFLSFLWWPNGNLDLSPETYKMVVHLFGAKSSPFCANYALRKTVTEFGEVFSDITRNTVNNNFYVDDCIVSVDDPDTAITLRKELCDLLDKGGFKLMKWVSNDKNVLKTIPSDLRSSSLDSINLDKDDLPVLSTLGISWKIENDSFEVRSNKPIDKPFTRRGILSTISSIYDPVGIVSPFCIKPKLLVQSLCRQKYNWDEVIGEEETIVWSDWLQDLPKIKSISIPRCILPSFFKKIKFTEIHTFCDASSVAYAAVSDVRYDDDQVLDPCDQLVNHFSSLNKLQRSVLEWFKRFLLYMKKAPD